MNSICCTKCSLKFINRNEYLDHVQTKHLKYLIINTDIGCNVAFSRVAPGKFTCPTCYSACNDINDVLLHLLCEEVYERNDFDQLEPLELLEFNSLHPNTTDSESKKNTDYDQNYFDFLLTSYPNLQSNNIYTDIPSNYSGNEDKTKQSNFAAGSNYFKRKKTRTDSHDYEHDKFKSGPEMNKGKLYSFQD